MHVEHHPLIKDFPERRELLHELRQSDPHFAQKALQYEDLDKRICRVEDGLELLDDTALHTLKNDRVALKDEIARQLKRASGSCCGKCGG
ncbi:GTP-binding protein [Stutzerimonas kirkiae]|uniref:GTP-binding protein n=1 Tax=Stutzerimonas kirkiae TaxID=2211392 RepID=A0A4Q9QZD9_9GAMM|nr:YdcH family protein [Stutzerimonas kirkiae]TBU90975.1 GTP-binding protein [Stutzerimonas kirkiae]TBV00311.1 GTP-binding protein [Stutzerimonas kirkiae]